ncbi:S1-C subfamily serine protease [Metabacillus crassostreae]|uniref:S1C family serine protease n=1 Tax=Metabacillus crassostreae TaxID=929098 RepID=UPI00195854A7|nr:trypsin-like peptidase domain-containing protein [Metabacillus crassostreae]MBM7602109.1 S1-C subfamily serine protease [Metabacillus crassostreae]
MDKKIIFSIIVSLLILVFGVFGYFYTKNYTASKIYSESTILKKNSEENSTQTIPEIKEIIRESQKKVVMVELEDGTVGSGFLYNEHGDIITNAHVVDGASSVKIRTTDAKGYDGEVIGISTETDIAVVRVEGLKNIEPLTLSPSTELEIGDEILALGSPLGFQNTVTTGIISGTDRELNVEPYIYENVYQISAPIAPGNSGGPLLDRKSGHVVGINSARIEQGNIGFSIPISAVLPLVNGWSETPMRNLPSVTSFDIASKVNVNKMLETSDYLINYFIESINFRDFVTAYSLLGSDWQSNVKYETFREKYLHINAIKIIELKKEIQEDKVIVETVLSIEEHNGNKNITKTYNKTFVVAYENDQAKIISEKQDS